MDHAVYRRAQDITKKITGTGAGIMENNRQYFEANRKLWNARTPLHASSEFYNVAEFKKGKTSLTSIERSELKDVKGKRLLHLQCHFGMDTISWEREGAIVTGIDISDEAIKLARQLSEEMHMNARFVCSNIYDLKESLQGKFDIVFTSYGTIGWLPDLDKWASIISHYLEKGGTFYMADFHPVLWMFDDNFGQVYYSYFNKGVIRSEVPGSYAERNTDLMSVEYGWNHSMSEIISALIRYGMKITAFNEFPYSPFNCFRNMVKGEDGNYRIRGFDEKLPMVFSLKAVKE
jgi:2-polyprenyl-3-methyl-5-hydroxy-6-metoxy-1,4-benzoquinol methylase